MTKDEIIKNLIERVEMLEEVVYGRFDFEQKDEQLYEGFVPKLEAYIRNSDKHGREVTKNSLRKHAGRGGVFDVSDQVMRRLIDEAIENGDIISEKVGPRKYVLKAPELF